MSKPSILERWGITAAELTELVDLNPSLRGILLGYVAEKKFHDSFLDHPDITEKRKDDDHDRKKKGDRRILYKGREFTVEVKSLQTASVKRAGEDVWVGKAQVDGSDKRVVRFPDGTDLATTLLLRGEFDILAVNCFAFGEQWRFLFVKNRDLPPSKHKSYTEQQQNQLIASLVTVSWPPQPPFTDNPFDLLEELMTEPEPARVIEEGKTETTETVRAVEVVKLDI